MSGSVARLGFIFFACMLWSPGVWIRRPRTLLLDTVTRPNRGWMYGPVTPERDCQRLVWVANQTAQKNGTVISQYPYVELLVRHVSGEKVHFRTYIFGTAILLYVVQVWVSKWK